MVCDSCRQRAGILIAVGSESRSAGDWQCLNLEWGLGFTFPSLAEIAACWYKCSTLLELISVSRRMLHSKVHRRGVALLSLRMDPKVRDALPRFGTFSAVFKT